MSNSIRLILNQSIARAIQNGHERVIVGASSEAMRKLFDGKILGTPFPVWDVEAIVDGVARQLEVPLFCDPGLPGISVYAIPWPNPNPGDVAVFGSEERE